MAYFAPSWVFASINIMVGTWVLYLPHIKAKFALSDYQQPDPVQALFRNERPNLFNCGFNSG